MSQSVLVYPPKYKVPAKLLINVNSIPKTPKKTTTTLDIANIYETPIIKDKTVHRITVSP